MSRLTAGFFFIFVWGMIYLMTQINNLDGHFVDLCRSFFPNHRNEQMMTYRFPRDRKLCAASYLLLVYALRNEGLFTTLPLFQYGTGNETWQSGNKPVLANYPGVHFSISHCSGVAVCAVSHNPVGIDVEKVEPYDDQLAQAICSPSEYEWVQADGSVRAERLTELWTRKESTVKCSGMGLQVDPRLIPSLGSAVTSFFTDSDNLLYAVSRADAFYTKQIS